MAEAAPIRQLPTNVFDRMTFPDYEFREFPMAIPLVNGIPSTDPAVLKDPYDRSVKPVKAYPVVIVNSQAELDALSAGEVEMVPVAPLAVESANRVETEEDVRDELYVRADQAGIKYDKRWSIERIEKAIAESQKPVL